MDSFEQVAQLKRQAIQILLIERHRIDEELTLLGHGNENAAPQKRRGRKPKQLAVGTQESIINNIGDDKKVSNLP